MPDPIPTPERFLEMISFAMHSGMKSEDHPLRLIRARDAAVRADERHACELERFDSSPNGVRYLCYIEGRHVTSEEFAMYVRAVTLEAIARMCDESEPVHPTHLALRIRMRDFG
jgi:hypothetical protein